MTYYDIKDVHKLIKEEKHYTLYSSYSSSLSTPLSSSTSGTLIKSTLKIGNSRPAGGRASDLMTTNKKSCRVLPKSHQKPLQNTEPTGCLPDAQCRTGSRRTRSSTGYQLIALAFLLYNVRLGPGTSIPWQSEPRPTVTPSDLVSLSDNTFDISLSRHHSITDPTLEDSRFSTRPFNSSVASSGISNSSAILPTINLTLDDVTDSSPSQMRSANPVPRPLASSKVLTTSSEQRARKGSRLRHALEFGSNESRNIAASPIARSNPGLHEEREFHINSHKKSVSKPGSSTHLHKGSISRDFQQSQRDGC